MAVLALAARRVRRPVVRGVVLATAAGAAFGMASVFTKAVAEDWAERGMDAAALLPTLGAIALLASAGMLLSQASYRGAGLAAPLATVTVVNPVVAAAVGVVALGEAFRYGIPGGLLAATAGAVAAAGVITLTLRSAGGTMVSAARAPEGAAGAGGATSTAGATGARGIVVMAGTGTRAEGAPAPVLPGARQRGRSLVPSGSGPEAD